MRKFLLKSLSAAAALCLAMPGQAAMGDTGVGGLPRSMEVLQDAEVRFSSTPNAVSYTGITDDENIVKAFVSFSVENYTSNLYVRYQFYNITSTASVTLENSNGEKTVMTLDSLDSDNGFWVPAEYVQVNGAIASVNGYVLNSHEGTISYSIQIYSSMDLSEVPLASIEECQIVFMNSENFPRLSLGETRVSGDVNTDIPFQVTVAARGLTGQSGFQLNFRWEGADEYKDLFSIKGDGITQSVEDGRYIYSIPSLQSQAYTFTATATAECRGSVYVYLSDSEGSSIAGNSFNVIIPIEYSQTDIDALKAMAEANPLSTDLQDFIDNEYYLEDWSSDTGRNVGVVWSTDDTCRVKEFYLKDYESLVTKLDLTSLSALEQIELRSTGVEKLDLSTLTNLNWLSLYNTKLLWEDVTLPSSLPDNFGCYGYTYVEATGATPVNTSNAYTYSGTQIDLSDYAEVNGTESTYQWYQVDENTGAYTEVSRFAGSEYGAFILIGTPGEYFVCEVSNELFAGWVMRTPRIKISRTSTDYSSTDTEALRKLANDNPQVSQLKEFVDSKGWEVENWDSSSDVIATDWSGIAPYRLTHLRIKLNWGNEPDTISKLDLSAFTELKWFECERFMSISGLDLSENTKLEYLHVYSRNLESIDVSMCPNLTTFAFYTGSIIEDVSEYNRTKLKSINLSGCTKLETFKLEHAHVASFDFSPYKHLREIYIGNCQDLVAQSLTSAENLQILSLPQTTQFGDYIQNLPSSITELDLTDTEYELPSANVSQNLLSLGVPTTVEEIDLNDYPNLRTMDVGLGNYGSSKLQYSNVKNYRKISFDGLSQIQLQSPSHPEDSYLFENGDTIDLSSEAVVNGIASTYIWVNAKYNTEETEAIKEVEGRPGVFVLDSKEEVYGEYYCVIWNTQFCDWCEITSWSGWRMTTSNIYVETGNSSSFHQGDVQAIAQIVADTDNSALQEWWDSDAWQTGGSSGVAQAVWNNDEPCRLTELYINNISNGFAETVDLSALDKLEVVSLASTSVKNVVLPENTEALRSLTLSSTAIESLIVSPYEALEYLDVSYMNLTALDFSNNANLTGLKLNGLPIESVETTNPTLAARLTSYGVPSTTTSIDLAVFPALKQLYAAGSDLRFSGVQNPRQMDPITDDTYTTVVGTNRDEYTPYGSTLDFSSEMNIGGTQSTIVWESVDALDGTATTLGTSASYLFGDNLVPGDYVTATIENALFPGWIMRFQTTVYTCDGDANLDKVVNVADVTATVSYILRDEANMIERFGFGEADVNYDYSIEIADVVGIVNIIQGKAVAKTSELRDAYQPTVLLELDKDRFLTMTSQVPVAGIQLEFTGATEELPLLSDAAHFVQASTLNGDTLRTVGYSMDGKTIPTGKTIIMQLPAGVKLLKAVFSDADANSLRAEGDIVPTANETIETVDQIEAIRNYPNPFSGSTTFSYNLKEPATSVAIQVFSTSGALVETIKGLPANVGLNRCTVSIQLPGGIYYYRLLLDGKTVSDANTMKIK